jgi:hypothetical protein
VVCAVNKAISKYTAKYSGALLFMEKIVRKSDGNMEISTRITQVSRICTEKSRKMLKIRVFSVFVRAIRVQNFLEPIEIQTVRFKCAGYNPHL